MFVAVNIIRGVEPLHIQIEERNKPNPLDLGQKLIVLDNEYDDLDEIIVKVVDKVVEFADTIIRHNKAKAKEQLEKEKKDNQSRIPYIIGYGSAPGHFALFYLPSTLMKYEDIQLSPRGYKIVDNEKNTEMTRKQEEKRESERQRHTSPSNNAEDDRWAEDGRESQNNQRNESKQKDNQSANQRDKRNNRDSEWDDRSQERNDNNQNKNKNKGIQELTVNQKQKRKKKNERSRKTKANKQNDKQNNNINQGTGSNNQNHGNQYGIGGQSNTGQFNNEQHNLRSNSRSIESAHSRSNSKPQYPPRQQPPPPNTSFKQQYQQNQNL
ncbi:MAG: hypothetical protein EZS28_013228 [Streblomastix strix]|uniref:Spt6 SH2 domain-containing protein n=1 Tax=Streblomastix strix TaxID=222440 RepID=A0A5J4W972_9EUKA|nr:MAG: hypothetical protein EZS28_013228 [Streblomastix strix]